MKNYTIRDFKSQFPDEQSCVSYMFNHRYGKDYRCKQEGCNGKYYRVKNRKCYACSYCGYQIHPTAGTIFHKSSTSLVNWFYAIFLFSCSRNGVSAKELERQLGVTYKTAWRIAKQVRSLMKEDGDMLNGTVEVDETYVGGYKEDGQGGKEKIPVLGMVERDGKVKAHKIEARQSHIILKDITKNVSRDAQLMTDQFGVYQKTKRLGYKHESVNHFAKEYARGKVSTNTIEGFWSQFKRSLHGTYHSVSPKHLQSYLDEFSFRYSYRASFPLLFSLMISRV